MFTLALSQPLPTAPLAIPPLNLNGRVPPRNANIGLEHIEKPAGMSVWAEFHNGAAAGLKISPFLSQVLYVAKHNIKDIEPMLYSYINSIMDYFASPLHVVSS